EMGRTEVMLDGWIEAILRVGNDPADTGPDLMLGEFPMHYAAVRGGSAERVLRYALAIARAEAHATLPLRLAAPLRAIGIEDDRLPRVTQENLDAASGPVLVKAARGERTRDPVLALQMAEHALARSPYAPYAAEAWQLVAELRNARG